MMNHISDLEIIIYIYIYNIQHSHACCSEIASSNPGDAGPQPSMVGSPMEQNCQCVGGMTYPCISVNHSNTSQSWMRMSSAVTVQKDVAGWLRVS